MRTRTNLASPIATACLLVTTLGCATYHTTYTNLHPPGQDPVGDAGATLEEAGFFDGWEHFWIFGLLPLENRVAAAAECESAGVEQVRTYQSGLQFLLSNVQGAFIFVNVWSPYTAKIDCARAEVGPAARSSTGVDDRLSESLSSDVPRQSIEPTFLLSSLEKHPAPFSRGQEDVCRDACVDEHRMCVTECGEHSNPIECDHRCRRAMSACERRCR